MTKSRRGHGASIRHLLNELPAQLSEERLKELAEKVRNNEASPQDVEELALSHIRLALSIVSRYSVHAQHLSDVFESDVLYGLVLALTRAPEKLYDENITPYLVKYMKKFAFQSLINDRLVSVPYSTIKRRRKLGLPTLTAGFPNSGNIHPNPYGLYETKDLLEACIQTEFEKEVITLRSLGYSDEEISVKMSCSRSGVSAAKRAVKKRFDQANE